MPNERHSRVVEGDVSAIISQSQLVLQELRKRDRVLLVTLSVDIIKTGDAQLERRIEVPVESERVVERVAHGDVGLWFVQNLSARLGEVQEETLQLRVLELDVGEQVEERHGGGKVEKVGWAE